MSDAIHHECGLAYIRLLKPLAFYHRKYGTAFYGLNKLYLLMEKQHNRGQDGAGVATIKLDPEPGANFIDRERSTDKQAIQRDPIGFSGVLDEFASYLDEAGQTNEAAIFQQQSTDLKKNNPGKKAGFKLHPYPTAKR